MNKLLSFFDYKPNILLPIFALFLPIFAPLSQVAILLYLISWLWNKQYLHLFRLRQNSILFLFLYCFLFLLSGLYSDNTILWGADIESKLGLWIFPILLLSQQHYDKKVATITINALILGCLLLTLYLHIIQLTEPQAIRSLVHHFTLLNVIYLTTYISFTLFFSLYQFFTITERNKKIIYLGAAILAHYSLFAFGSRMAILSTICVELAVIFVWKVLVNRQYITGFVWLLFILIFNVGSLLMSNYALNRFKKLGSGNGDVRTLIWEASWLEIQKSPIIGHGAGDTQDVLRPRYLAINYPRGAEKNQNSHNQYLETGVSIGFIGILILMCWIFFSLYQGWHQQNYLLCIFIAIIALNILTESMFERQQGSYFIGFFVSLLYWYKPKSD